jgi:hypothetical protein
MFCHEKLCEVQFDDGSILAEALVGSKTGKLAAGGKFLYGAFG